MKKYIEKNAIYIGEGNTRKVYKIGNKVYKIASDPAYIENNKIEFQRYQAIPEKLKKYAPTFSLVKKDNYEILEVDYIEPLEDWIIRNQYMTQSDFLDACMDEQDVDVLCNSLGLDLYIPYELIAFMRDLGSKENELYYPANYGVKDDTLILLDFGDSPILKLENSSLRKMNVFQSE